LIAKEIYKIADDEKLGSRHILGRLLLLRTLNLGLLLLRLQLRQLRLQLFG
jgi:hypothetical protein